MLTKSLLSSEKEVDISTLISPANSREKNPRQHFRELAEKFQNPVGRWQNYPASFGSDFLTWPRGRSAIELIAVLAKNTFAPAEALNEFKTYPPITYTAYPGLFSKDRNGQFTESNLWYAFIQYQLGLIKKNDLPKELETLKKLHYPEEKQLWVDSDDVYQKTHLQLLPLLIEAQFDPDTAKKHFDELKPNYYNPADQFWYCLHKSDCETSNFYTKDLVMTATQLIGLLVQSYFYPETSRSNYQNLKTSPAFDRKTNFWRDSIMPAQAENSAVSDSNIKADIQLLAMILEHRLNKLPDFTDRLRQTLPILKHADRTT